MSALLTDRRAAPQPPHRRRDAADCGPRPEPPPESSPTLDDVVSRTWEMLRAGVPSACLVCGHELTPRPSAGAGVVGGRCESCGSTIA